MIIRNEARRRRVILEEIQDYLAAGGNAQVLYKSTLDSIENYKKELESVTSMKITQSMWHHIADLELMSELLKEEYIKKTL